MFDACRPPDISDNDAKPNQFPDQQKIGFTWYVID